MEIKAKSLVAEQLLQLRRLALFISPHWHSQCRLMLFLLQAQPQLFRWLQQPRAKNTSSLVLLSGGRALSRCEVSSLLLTHECRDLQGEPGLLIEHRLWYADLILCQLCRAILVCPKALLHSAAARRTQLIPFRGDC